MITSQAASVTQASAAIEEMVGNIGSVTSSINTMAVEFENLIQLSGRGKNAQTESREKINQIAEKSASLLQANRIIATIASQTNLLAMNAAIEAAHAGDAGAGFAVVADEIRKLAETSAGQSQSIRAEINAMQKAIEEVVQSSQSSEDAFDNVSERITETDILVKQVQAAMNEQKIGSSQILETLQTVNKVTSSVQSGSKEMRTGNTVILETVQHLKNASLAIKTNIEQIADGFGGIETASQAVSNAAGAIVEHIKSMQSAVGSFKT
jgi:methyl-accepting chemotaxis protein